MLLADPETELSGLIGQIYDAALDPTLWPAILPDLTNYVGGQAAALLAKTLPDATASMFYYCGVSPDYMRAYLDFYWRYDMFGIVESLGFPIGQPIVTDDLIPYDEFRQGKFFREWAAPQGWIDSVWVVIDRSSTGFGFFSVLRNAQAGRVDAGVRRRMALIAPHIRRAVLIGNVTDRAQSEARNFAAAFEQLRAAVFFVDPSGRVQHANTAARDMLDRGLQLRLGNGRLAAADDQADRALRAAYLAASAGDMALGGNAIAVLLGGQPRYVAHVLPLTAGSRRHDGVGGTAVAAVFVQRQELPRLAAPELIANAYRLTPTELRVLLAVVEVGGVPEVAEALGIAETTVRTHLGRVYEKTELNRQADLVKLVADFRARSPASLPHLHDALRVWPVHDRGKGPNEVCNVQDNYSRDPVAGAGLPDGHVDGHHHGDARRGHEDRAGGAGLCRQSEVPRLSARRERRARDVRHGRRLRRLPGRWRQGQLHRGTAGTRAADHH